MVAFVCIYINAKKFEETIEFYKKLLNKDIEVQYKTRWAQIKINEGLRLAFLNIKFDKDAIESNIDIEKHYNVNFIRNLPTEYCSGNSIILNMVAKNFHEEYERVKQLSTNVSTIQYVKEPLINSDVRIAEGIDGYVLLCSPYHTEIFCPARDIDGYVLLRKTVPPGKKHRNTGRYSMWCDYASKRTRKCPEHFQRSWAKGLTGTFCFAKPYHMENQPAGRVS